MLAAYARTRPEIDLPAYCILEEPGIDKQIGLTDRQRYELFRIMAEREAKALAKGRLAADHRPPEEERKAVRKRIEAILTPQQVNKLQDLSFTAIARQYLDNPALLKQIVDRGDRKQIQEITRRWKALDSQGSRSALPWPEAAEKARDRFLGLLTDQQRTTLRKELWRLDHPAADWYRRERGGRSRR